MDTEKKRHRSSSNASSPSSTRTQYIEYLRLVGCLGVISLHCARFFGTLRHNYGYRNSANTQNKVFYAEIFEELARYLSQWIMPLFFFLSGFALNFSIKQRRYGLLIILQERVMKLILPFCTTILVIVLPTQYLLHMHFENQRHHAPEPLHLFIYNFFTEPSRFRFFHTWFLPVLFVITLVELPFLIWARVTYYQKIAASSRAASLATTAELASRLEEGENKLKTQQEPAGSQGVKKSKEPKGARGHLLVHFILIGAIALVMFFVFHVPLHFIGNVIAMKLFLVFTISTFSHMPTNTTIACGTVLISLFVALDQWTPTYDELYNEIDANPIYTFTLWTYWYLGIMLLGFLHSISQEHAQKQSQASGTTSSSHFTSSRLHIIGGLIVIPFLSLLFPVHFSPNPSTLDTHINVFYIFHTYTNPVARFLYHLGTIVWLYLFLYYAKCFCNDSSSSQQGGASTNQGILARITRGFYNWLQRSTMIFYLVHMLPCYAAIIFLDLIASPNSSVVLVPANVREMLRNPFTAFLAELSITWICTIIATFTIQVIKPLRILFGSK